MKFIFYAKYFESPRSLNQGCQVIVTEKCQTPFHEMKNFEFHYRNFHRLIIGQLLYKFSKISKPINLKKRPNLFFGLEKAKPLLRVARCL